MSTEEVSKDQEGTDLLADDDPTKDDEKEKDDDVLEALPSENGDLNTPTHLMGSNQFHESLDYFPIDGWDGDRVGAATLDPTEIDVGLLAPPLPPDGGWGWMIVFGSFVCMCLVDGMCFSYGIFLSELENTFKASKMKMTLGGSLLTGCYLIMGPITSALANQFGFRPVILFGAVISSSAIFVSAFIYNLDVFIVVFGILGGSGYGLVYLPAVTVVSLWFHRYRATATGIALCGSGIGAAVYGVLLPFLIEKYTWRGCLIILAGVSFNCAVAGALFRPLMSIDTGAKGGGGGSSGPNSNRNSMGEGGEGGDAGGGTRPESMSSPDRKMQELVRRYAAQEAGNHAGNHDGDITTDAACARPSSEARKLLHMTSVNSGGNSSQFAAPSKPLKKKKSKPKRYPKNSIIQRTIEGKKRDKAVSVGSLDNMLITENNILMPLSTDYTERPMVSMNTINRIVESVLQKQERRAPDFRSRTSLHSAKPRSSSTQHSQPCLVREYVQPADQQSAIFPQHMASRRSSFYSSVVSLKPAIDRGSHIDEDTKTEIVNKLRKELARPMNKKDVFYSGSMIHLQEHINPPDKSGVRSMHSFPETAGDLGGGDSPIRNAISQMLDISILKSPTFIMLVISSVFSMIGFIVPFQFLKDSSQHLGFSRNLSSYLMSILGSFNTLGRILAGLLSDRPWADCLWINNISLLIAGVATILLPFCTTYAMLSLYASVFGIFIAAFISLRSILVVELIGLDRLSNAFGFLLLFQGIAIVIGPPILASFYDALNNYDYTFYLGGASLVLSSLLCVPVRLIARWEAQRNAVVYESPSMDNIPREATV